MDKKLNILQVLPALNVGGLERGAVEMANFHTQNGHKSYVASNGGTMVDMLDTRVTHIELPLHRRTPWHLYKCSKAIANIIKQENIDIVHARSRIPSLAARWACTCTKTPMVATFHGTHKTQNAFKRWYNSGAAKADRIIAISQFIKTYIKDTFSTDDRIIDIAHRGVDTSIFTPKRFTSEDIEALKKQHNIPENVPILNLTGRITRWKGHTQLIEALSHVKDLQWVCLFIGDFGKKSNYEAELKELIRHHELEDKILFLGNQKDPAPFYLMSDLAFSMATQPEAFGRVSIEAGAMGTAIFATAHGGSLETVIHNETGFLVPPFNTNNMAEILRTALQNTEMLHKMGDKARQHVHNNFTMEKMCAAEWLAYKKLLNL